MSELTEKDIVKVVEAALFTSGKPMSAKQLWRLFPRDEHLTIKQVKKSLESLEKIYAKRGVVLKEVASGYRFQIEDETFPWLDKLYEEKPQKYSRALMETLSLVAYRQPITRGEIEEVRGVSVSSNIIHTLLEHEWIKAVGHREVPGRPTLYATTTRFLDYFGLKSLSELPPLAELDIDSLDKAHLEDVKDKDVVKDENVKTPEQLEFAVNDPNAEEVDNSLKRDKMDQIIMTASAVEPDPKGSKDKGKKK